MKDSASILTPESRTKIEPEPVCLGRTKILGDPLSSRWVVSIVTYAAVKRTSVAAPENPKSAFFFAGTNVADSVKETNEKIDPRPAGMNGVKDSGSILTPESRIKIEPEPVCSFPVASPDPSIPKRDPLASQAAVNLSSDSCSLTALMRRPPSIANRGSAFAGTNATASVKETNEKIDPDPISVAGVVDSAALPSKVKRLSSLPGTNATDSAVPVKEKIEPEPMNGLTRDSVKVLTK